MEFDNAFEVPLPVEDAWKVLMDIRRIAPCMPGAELTDVIDDRTYKGKIGVRLGPVALTFAGTVKFEEIDDANHTARVVAQGTDAKGRGAANAVASFRLEPTGGTAEVGTKVLVHTNLTLSGAVAQYGRGVGIIQMTAAAIITQFANNLKAQLGRDGAVPAHDRDAGSPARPEFLRPCGAIRRGRCTEHGRAGGRPQAGIRRRPRAQWLPSRQPLPRPYRLRLSRFPASPCSAPWPGSGSNGSLATARPDSGEVRTCRVCKIASRDAGSRHGVEWRFCARGRPLVSVAITTRAIMT